MGAATNFVFHSASSALHNLTVCVILPHLTKSHKVKFQELAKLWVIPWEGGEDLKRQNLAHHLVDMSLQVVIRISEPMRLKYGQQEVIWQIAKVLQLVYY